MEIWSIKLKLNHVKIIRELSNIKAVNLEPYKDPPKNPNHTSTLPPWIACTFELTSNLLLRPLSHLVQALNSKSDRLQPT